MKPKGAAPEPAGFNRRDFIRNTSFGTLMLLAGGVPIEAAEAPANHGPGEIPYSTDPPPVSLGIIGCGLRGREIAQTLAKLVNGATQASVAPVVALCDTYEPFTARTKRDHAPEAQTFTDYRRLLAQKNVEAVVVATPSHQHREIVEAALQAGKHVYCEAPLATTIEDARAIAKAAQAAFKSNFQSGLQLRSDPLNWQMIQPLAHAAPMGAPVMARSQWHKKQAWRRSAADPARERALNWRLYQETSPGLIGEIGIHQLDLITWFLGKRPAAVTGWGGILNWKDDRAVADTVQCVLEHPDGYNHAYDASLNNSFDSEYSMLYGAEAAIMLRDGKAWLFKEKDSPLFGWEVYARKDKDLFYDATGISIVPDTGWPIKGNPPATETKTPLHHALAAFVSNCDYKRKLVAEYTAIHGADAPAGLSAYVVENMKDADKRKKIKPAAGVREGFEATVTALKANEAINQGRGSRIVLQPDWYEI